jgi:hypothetical protein
MPLNPGEIYSVGDPEFIGNIPIRQEIEVLPADEPKEIKIEMHGWIIVDDHDEMKIKTPGPIKLGWIVHESIGIGVVNTRGVSAARKSVVVGK